MAPVLDPVKFTDMTFARTVSDMGGADTLWTVNIKGLQNVALKTSNGNILVYFPRLTIAKSITDNPVCTVNAGGSDFTTDCTIIYHTQTA